MRLPVNWWQQVKLHDFIVETNHWANQGDVLTLCCDWIRLPNPLSLLRFRQAKKHSHHEGPVDKQKRALQVWKMRNRNIVRESGRELGKQMSV